MSKNDYIIVGALAVVAVGYFVYTNKKSINLPIGIGKGTTTPPKPNAQLQAWIDKIKASPDWYSAVVQKAKDNGNSVDYQLLLDAQFMLETSGSAITGVVVNDNIVSVPAPSHSEVTNAIKSVYQASAEVKSVLNQAATNTGLSVEAIIAKVSDAASYSPNWENAKVGITSTYGLDVPVPRRGATTNGMLNLVAPNDISQDPSAGVTATKKHRSWWSIVGGFLIGVVELCIPGMGTSGLQSLLTSFVNAGVKITGG